MEHRVPEPFEIGRGSLLELIERTDAMLIHEVPQIASLHDSGRRPPDHGSLPAHWRLNAHSVLTADQAREERHFFVSSPRAGFSR